METCARCGKQLEWHEQRMVFWNKQLQKGYIKWYVIGSRDMGKRKEFPEYKGKKLCQTCAHEVFTGTTVASPAPVTSGDPTADFAALRVFLKENGVTMTAFNCPKCGNMVDIPETGKLLICKHCGNPIKPADIYEKMKTLLE